MTTRFSIRSQSVKDTRKHRMRQYIDNGERRVPIDSSLSDIEISFDVEDDFEEFMYLLRSLEGIRMEQDTVRLLAAVVRKKIPHETVCAMLSISLMGDVIGMMGETDGPKDE